MNRFSLKKAVLCGIGAGALLGGRCVLGQPAQFSDRTAVSGLTAVHTNQLPGQMMWMTGGAAAGDFNNDGWQDLFVLGGPGAPDKLYINNHDGTFTNRAVAAGVARVHAGYGIAVGDFDNDGWLDIFVTSGGADGLHCQHLLYRNNGDGMFTDVAQQAGVQTTTFNTTYDGFGAAWGDYDLDGYLDLAVAGWNYNSGGNRLFHNNGNGTFTDVTQSALGYNMRSVEGFSPRFVDMNGDRYPELLWVSDFGGSKYFVNNGDGTFTESTATAGVGLEGNGMGTTIGDFNGDGRPDWFVTSIYAPTTYPSVPGTGNMLYLNNGADHFTESAGPMGVRQSGWGWGTVAVDLRNAGRLDIVATNGYQSTYYGTQFIADPTRVYLNSGAGAFADAAPGCGITHTGQGRGVVNFDYDNDGSQDILIATNAGPLTLYHNQRSGAGANYLRVFLNTSLAPSFRRLAPNGYGAHVIATADGVTQHRWICGGSNYLSQSELSAHFGFGSAASISEVRVEWPDGTTTVRKGVPVNRTMTISSCAPDWNGDGLLSIQDIFDFLNAWFGGSGDYNASGDVSVQDIFDFLNAWFAGCA